MKRILIIKPSSMGDVLHAFPAVHGLKQSFPDAEIDWVIHPAFEELLDYLPLSGRRILFRRKELGSVKNFFREFPALVRELRKEKYDAVLDLQGLLRSALLGALTRSPRRYGPAELKESIAKCFYTGLLHWKAETAHALEKNCEMISGFLGGKTVPPRYTLPVVDKYVKRVDQLFQKENIPEAGKLIAIAPGARWVTKQWDSAAFAECARILSVQLPEAHFLLLGSPGEKELCAAIGAALEGKVPCTDLCAKTSMGELPEVIRRSEVLLCNDSGPMHAAAALQTPLVAFFAPTDPVLTGPYSGNSLVLTPDLPCLKCFRRECASGKCRKALSARKMADSVLELLHKKGGKL